MKTTSKYNLIEVESKWQKKWLKENLYKTDDTKVNKYYVSVELAYTSGDLHIGHWFAWSAPDSYARFKRMQGYNVLFPVGGFDAFGLPAENAAIKHGIHPRDWTYKNIETMRKQFALMGPSFDWDKEVVTSDPDYYRWTQWLFLQLYKKGLAYRGKVWSNWCPECKTVLANEHVMNGCCWRHPETPVEQKMVDQWLVKITDYADRLIWKEPEGPERSRRIDWPKAHKDAQNNWIGKSTGLTVDFNLKDSNLELPVWTKFWETVFGTTFLVVSPEHYLLEQIKIPGKHKKEVSEYIKMSKSKTEKQRKEEAGDKTGVFTGLYAINPVNGEKIPVWVADYVLIGVGTGAIMGVPAHDQRDFDFAKKYDLKIVQVVSYKDKDIDQKVASGKMPFEGEGTLVNSGKFDGQDAWGKGKEEMADWMIEKGMASWQTTYHLRDWSVSRRRYWAAPVPIIYCRYCYSDNELRTMNHQLLEGIDYATLDDGKKYMIRTVPKEDLPVTLPENVDYMPTGMAPLATALEWIKTKCPVCGRDAQREAETLDTYVDSSWYLFRYPIPKYNKGPFNKNVIKDWMPMKVYFGGPEHILGHTLYARFITKFFKDLGLIDFDEFAEKRINHGVILGPDGHRMSKSRGNVVNPEEQRKKYGADTVRMYLCFLGPHEDGGTFELTGIEGTSRFLGRVWRLVKDSSAGRLASAAKNPVNIKMHQTIKKVTDDLEKFKFNTPIAAIMEYVNFLQEHKSGISREAVETLIKLLAPFAPHMAEELWVEVLGNKFSVHTSEWPKYDAELAKESQNVIVVQVNGRLRQQLTIDNQQLTNKEEIEKLAKKDPKVAKWLEGKNILKTIYIPRKLINFVTS